MSLVFIIGAPPTIGLSPPEFVFDIELAGALLFIEEFIELFMALLDIIEPLFAPVFEAVFEALLIHAPNPAIAAPVHKAKISVCFILISPEKVDSKIAHRFSGASKSGRAAKFLKRYLSKISPGRRERMWIFEIYLAGNLLFYSR
jgi:hypothetical protein